MSQISPPIRILLVCAVAFLAAWMLFLRPSSDAGTPAAETPAATTPPVEAGGEQAESLAGKAVEKANEATAAQDARAEELAGGAGETAATPETSDGAAVAPAPATATTTKTGAPTEVELPSREELATVPADVRRAFVKRQIVVIGVVSPKGSDDKRVRKSLGNVDKLHGRVFVKTVPVKQISRYGSITRGADLTQTPSVVVVDFGFKATTLAGWVDARTIDQAVVDGIRSSGQLYPDPYLRQVAHECSHAFPSMRRLEPASGREYSTAIGRYGTLVMQLKHDFAALSTPKKWRPFSKAIRADMTTLAATTASWHGALGANPTLAQAVTAYGRYAPAAKQSVTALNKRFDAHDVLGCGSKS
jgi:hypothetical protein